MKIRPFFSFIALSLSLSANAYIEDNTSLEQYEEFFKEQNIFITTPNTKIKDIEIFLQEFQKFPSDLHQELVKQGGKIHLLTGQGVAEDPSWDIENRATFDKRQWMEVPGSGGYPRSNIPTRIVINRLHDPHAHGSSNLFLHEHAHSLDSVYHTFGISNSEEWRNLIAENPEIKQYSLRVCGRYCETSESERFAELFAAYHHDEITRQQQEQEAPALAAFFGNLQDRNDLTRIHNISTNPPEEPQDQKPNSDESDEGAKPDIKESVKELGQKIRTWCKKNTRLAICQK